MTIANITIEAIFYRLTACKQRANKLDREAVVNSFVATMLYECSQQIYELYKEIDYRNGGELLPSGD